jgi:hypothetical protein
MIAGSVRKSQISARTFSGDDAMKLGIAVVYMASERNERLLDVHLSQIEKNTTIPYTIYAAISRLAPPLRKKLEEHPRVTICPCDSYVVGSGLLRQDRDNLASKGLTLLDSKYEHSWYLEQLIRRAIDDDVTHVALFHLDSFPIRHRWAQELISRLSDSCVLAGTVRDMKTDYKPLTAGILFHREFYLRYRPRLLLTQDELDSSDYRRYQEAHPHCADSGVGYGFKMFMHGLTWYPLCGSNIEGHHVLFGAVHGDLIFHLMSAVLVDRQNKVGRTVRPSQRRGLVGALAKGSTALVPEFLRRVIRTQTTRRINKWYQSKDKKDWESERALLFSDPESYITSLRTSTGTHIRSVID